MLRESPVWGVGFANFIDHHGIVAHNSFVHCFAELGAVGYFLWLGALLSTFWLLRQVASLVVESPLGEEMVRWAMALRLSLASFLAGALFLSRTYSISLFVLLGLSAALVSAAKKMYATEDRPWSVPPLRLAAVTTAVLVTSIATTYIVVRLGR